MKHFIILIFASLLVGCSSYRNTTYYDEIYDSHRDNPITTVRVQTNIYRSNFIFEPLWDFQPGLAVIGYPYTNHWYYFNTPTWSWYHWNMWNRPYYWNMGNVYYRNQWNWYHGNQWNWYHPHHNYSWNIGRRNSLNYLGRVVAPPRTVSPGRRATPPRSVTPGRTSQPRTVTPPRTSQPRTVTPPRTSQPRTVTPPRTPQPRTVTPPRTISPSRTVSGRG